MSDSDAGRALAYLRHREAEMAALLAELAAAESPTLVPASQQRVFDLLAAALEGSGMATRRLSGRRSGGQLLARPSPRLPAEAARAARAAAAGPADPAGIIGSAHRGGSAGRRPFQLLLGHSDTVWPLGTLHEMPVVCRDGRLFGPGVYDMKAGLVQAVFALRAVRDLGLELPAWPVLFVSSDEETGSGDSLWRLRRLARMSRRVFVLEPSLGEAGLLKTRRKGVGQFTLRVRGRAAHAGLDPGLGASAVLELARLILRLQALADPARGITVNVGTVGGGTRSNVVAAEAWAELDVRVGRLEDGLAVERCLRGLEPETPGTAIEIEGAFERGPLLPTTRNRELFLTAQRAAAELGIPLGEGAAGGASDGNFTSVLTATLDGLGAVGGGAHAAHEHVVLARMPERAALLACLLTAPLAAPAPAGSGVPPAAVEAMA